MDRRFVSQHWKKWLVGLAVLFVFVRDAMSNELVCDVDLTPQPAKADWAALANGGRFVALTNAALERESVQISLWNIQGRNDPVHLETTKLRGHAYTSVARDGRTVLAYYGQAVLWKKGSTWREIDVPLAGTVANAAMSASGRLCAFSVPGKLVVVAVDDDQDAIREIWRTSVPGQARSVALSGDDSQVVWTEDDVTSGKSRVMRYDIQRKMKTVCVNGRGEQIFGSIQISDNGHVLSYVDYPDRAEGSKCHLVLLRTDENKETCRFELPVTHFIVRLSHDGSRALIRRQFEPSRQRIEVLETTAGKEIAAVNVPKGDLGYFSLMDAQFNEDGSIVYAVSRDGRVWSYRY